MPGGSGAPALPSADDPQALLDALADGVSRALPAPVRTAALDVERRRSLADRLAGRPGSVVGVRLAASDETLTLRLEPGPRWQAQVARVSGGVVIARRTVPLGEWLDALAGRVAALAADAAGEASAAASALQALGVRTAAADVVVDDADVVGGLRALPSRVQGRVPDDAAALVSRIVGLLLDTLPRVAGQVAGDVVVRRAATAYLPDTLRAYLALPSGWATTHVFPDGRTPAQALTAQLALLASAVEELHDAALEDDAAAVLVNGRFLEDRFPASMLDR